MLWEDSTTLLSEGESIEDRTEKFRQEIKTPFLKDMMQEIDLALKIIEEVLLVFNMFNTKAKFSEEETWIKLPILKSFYGSTQCSIFQNEEIKAQPIIEFEESTLRKSLHYFPADFIKTMKLLENEHQIKMTKMLKSKTLAESNVEDYLEEQSN